MGTVSHDGVGLDVGQHGHRNDVVPIHLPGGGKLVIDFLEFHADGTCHFTDPKGMKTAMYKFKKKQVETLYPIVIEEI